MLTNEQKAHVKSIRKMLGYYTSLKVKLEKVLLMFDNIEDDELIESHIQTINKDLSEVRCILEKLKSKPNSCERMVEYYNEQIIRIKAGENDEI